MVLRYSLGAAVTGNVCSADEAFGKFDRYIDRVSPGPSWNWFIERVTSLEAELGAAGGFDERIAGQLEGTGTYFGPADVFERYERADYLSWQLEEAAIAFVVTLQTRLNALRMMASAVYERAAVEDQLPVSTPSELALFPSDLRSIWDVANYAKHSDEWGPALTKQQRPTFDGLLRIGVAVGTHDERALARFPTIEALVAISGERLRDAIPATLELCVKGGREMTAQIQSDLAPFSDLVDSVRGASRKRMMDGLHTGRDHREPDS
jgi:hypothetical protein